VIGVSLASAWAAARWPTQKTPSPSGPDAEAAWAAPPAPALFALLPAAGMAVLGMMSVRFAADAALVSAPILALGFTGLVGPLQRRWARPRPGATTATTMLVAGLLLAVTLLPRISD